MNPSLYIYPWDALDPSQPLAPWHEAGFKSLSLAVSYHAGKFLTPNHGRHRVVFPEDGTVYFPTNDEHYGELKAKTSAITSENPNLIDDLKEKGFDLAGWTVVNHNSRLGFKHPDTVTKNAFDDPYYYALCPANPDVHQYGIDLCKQVYNSGISHLKLESPGYLPFSHGYHHEAAQVNNDRYSDALLGLCFCRHCMDGSQAAGIDTPRLKEKVKALIDHHLLHNHVFDDALASQWLINILMTEPDLYRFLDWRCQLVSNFIQEVKNNLPSDSIVTVISSIQQPQATAIFEGVNLNYIAKVADGIELPAYQQTVNDTLADVSMVRGSLDTNKEPVDLSVILRPTAPDITSESQLNDTIDGLQQLGIEQFSFYNFGLLPNKSQQWLRSINALKK